MFYVEAEKMQGTVLTVPSKYFITKKQLKTAGSSYFKEFSVNSGKHSIR
ncbi:MAG: hypothetical protein J6J07_08590 [Oscillospiraceae bacterium]|nr:hypothetical protein [Oscillospiraceae bacterium]